MTLALVIPHDFPSVRGSSITVERIELGLRDHGVTVRVFSPDQKGVPA